MTNLDVDKNLCTGCGVCPDICPMGIISKEKDADYPYVPGEMSGVCIQCGQCEAFCPSEALVLNPHPGKKEVPAIDAGYVSSEDLAVYIKKQRRSIRNYRKEPVPRETILEILDITRYSASGGNGQPVEWIIIHDSEKVKRIASLTAKWMKTLLNSPHPISGYVPFLLERWNKGYDVVCRGAPHLAISHIPDDNPMAVVDGIISMTHFDIAAPAFGVGTCWAGFLFMAASSYEPLQKEIGILKGRRISYAMMFGYPEYEPSGIPGKKPLEVIWK
ncbi:MAG: nitroreductase family protein [Methanomicrobium sp.]|nr:nitroreductase family protein [Methanomicrobium sp.]